MFGEVQAHSKQPCGQIGETVDLDGAVQQALDFAKQDGQTLVVVTADGGEMAILYGTGEEDAAQGHTGTQLRIAAYGPGAANVVGLSDQTDLFFTIRDALSLSQR
ncbi:alkaline phosphatase [Glutamicibacter endophyticus]